ncbi:uncharacterized protein BP5553_02347 [Venustampulla echinocandica]|uniref:Uncharacterized protein n=1 Tax=Venustampulla echinocandica TaxID=2656787 RepID=A0A370U3M4_9HELO|nr:uncharacterized protein BP5553_02347 [Venustampulla echinocandica]RDL42368.1 hypothetical protein BP5553_02347 [Venustampulla echinocandica]
MAVEDQFTDWVRESVEWWGGTWAEYYGLAAWHLTNYLRRKKKNENESTSASTSQTRNSTAVGAEDSTSVGFDPIRDV